MAFTPKTYTAGQTVITAQNLNDINTFLGGGTDGLKDYVVEQGSSDIWTYRKWASGVAECWGVVSGTWNGDSLTVNYPFSFSSIESVQATGGWNDFSGSSYCTVIPTRETSKVVLRFYDLRGETVSGTVGASVHTTGRWK